MTFLSDGYMDPKETMRAAVNVVRWNAHTAIQWMERIQAYLQTFEEMEEWNKYAKIVNEEIDMRAKMRFYKGDHLTAYWGRDPRKGVIPLTSDIIQKRLKYI